MSTINPEDTQQTQSNHFTSRKRRSKKRSKNKNAYSIIAHNDKNRRVAKPSPSNSTLNSTLSYFPSLKCHVNTTQSPSIKNSNDTQRSVMESSANMFLFDSSPLSMHGSSTSFVNRKAGSMPRERFVKGDPEKDKLGREKLNKFHNRKHTDYQLNLLQNRIRKLAQEEKNAQRKIQETQRRAESFLQTRYKFEVDQSIKNEYRFQQQKELELKRERLRQERLNSYEKKK